MHHIKSRYSKILFALGLGLFSIAGIADDCGSAPEMPALVDGTKATMEELVATSESVKSFIATADVFLDCREGFIKSDAFKEISADEQKQLIEENSTLLNNRNGIGDAFNKEVAAFKAANPQ